MARPRLREDGENTAAEEGTEKNAVWLKERRGVDAEGRNRPKVEPTGQFQGGNFRGDEGAAAP